MKQRVISRKTRGRKRLRLGEDWHSQLVVSPWPETEMDNDARQGRPRPDRKDRSPPRILTFRGDTDPRRDACAPECACKPESQFRLQNKSNSAEQLEPVMHRSQY